MQNKKKPTVIKPENAQEVIGRQMLVDVFPFVLDLEKSSGNYLYDAKGKRPLLDCFSFIASNPVGFNHPKMSDPEFEKKLLRAAKSKPSNSDLYCVEMAEFVDTFSRVALPDAFTHVFFVEGGTLAVENALKAAFDWKIRLNRSRGLTGEVGTKILHFKEAFHGRSGYTLSLTNTADPRKTKLFPKFDWPRVLNPKCRFPLAEAELNDVIEREKEALAQIRDAFSSHGPDIAAIIVEPIQGEGGDNHFRPEFHQALRKVADENDAMLIYDEVQSGVGLTGRMWAYQHYGVIPDMVAFGKKMQVCGFMCGSRIDTVPDNVFVERSRINSTWGGSLVDMVRAQRYLEIIEEDNLVENAEKVGEYLQSQLLLLAERSQNLLTNIRGKGLMCAFDLGDGALRDKFVKRTLDHGAIVLPCGTHSVRVRPSLTFSVKEVDELVAIFERTVADLK